MYVCIQPIICCELLSQEVDVTFGLFILQGQFHWVEENSQKTDDCYYLFELEHDAACSQEVSSPSIGSIVCLVYVL